MSGPDGIDERFGTLMGELRSGEATASPELRERVRAIATRRPEPPAVIRWLRLPRRRVTLVLVPACALIAAAVGVGVVTSDGGGQKAIELHGEAAKTKSARGAYLYAQPPRPHSQPLTRATAGKSAYDTAAVPPPSGSRYQ